MLLNALVSLLGLSFDVYGQRAPASPVVDLGYAIYEGTFNQTTNVTSFLGIRFAAPPVRKLRFRAPQPSLNERSLGVQKTDTIFIGCVQTGDGNKISTPFRPGNVDGLPQKRQSTNPEDCLFLNVWTPGTLKPNAKLPMLVWIHGGGYVAGNVVGTTSVDLIREAGGGLIAVTLDCRLGVFGFLPGAQVKQKGGLNAGLLDQQAVLQWVRRNVTSLLQ
ncbi:Alpha/Beta hydrolase protein [Irpex rosettiformis]|uniref:Alpha/Beta hydrolase protein n=1 Tax=Irpex rosettiformis TaxID=378272 RepID=A0ACB8TTM7_9APHY|nr:Alpha/Beta hydrolase protein [Irpex rosettiformis]